MFHIQMKAVFRKKWVVCLIAAIAVLGGAIGWYIVLDPRFHTVIDQQIYRSAQLSTSELETFTARYHIRTIVSLLGPEKGNPSFDNEKKFAQKHHLQMLNIAFASHELPPQNHLTQLITALSTLPKPILLHCFRGSDRSGMASAIALILFKDAPLKMAERQCSWRFGVVPYTDSIGVLFFDRYEQWLKTTGKSHSQAVFLDWALHRYVDPNGNIEYEIGGVNHTGFKDSFWRHALTAVIHKDTGGYIFTGWARDESYGAPVKTLMIGIGPLFRQVTYAPPSQTASGTAVASQPQWICRFDEKDISPGCHDIRLSVGAPHHDIPLIQTQRRLCIENTP